MAVRLIQLTPCILSIPSVSSLSSLFCKFPCKVRSEVPEKYNSRHLTIVYTALTFRVDRSSGAAIMGNGIVERRTVWGTWPYWWGERLTRLLVTNARRRVSWCSFELRTDCAIVVQSEGNIRK